MVLLVVERVNVELLNQTKNKVVVVLYLVNHVGDVTVVIVPIVSYVVGPHELADAHGTLCLQGNDSLNGFFNGVIQ